MSKSKINQIILIVILYLPLYLVSQYYLEHIYFYEWSARHLYLYTWVIASLLVLLNRSLPALTLSIGNLIGVILGQHLGDWIKARNMAKISSDMSAEELYQLQKHLPVG